MTIDLRFRPSQWAVDSVGSSTRGRRPGVTVERPRQPQGSRGTATRSGPLATRQRESVADGLPPRWLESLRRRWARLLAARELDAATLANRFERQLPNLAAELRCFAASASDDPRRGGC